MEKKEESAAPSPAAPAPEAPVATTAAEVKKEEAPKAEAKKEEVKKFEEGMPISPFVKKEFVDELLVYGFTKNASEKALYLTGGVSPEKAMEWIEKHQNEPDFNEELRIVGYSFLPHPRPLDRPRSRRSLSAATKNSARKLGSFRPR